jgi:putative flippase GtrA
VRRLAGFSMVGVMGFALDAGLTALFIALEAHPLAARLVALPLAVGATFVLNSRITFADRSPGPAPARAFGRYVAANAAAMVVNYATYALCLAGVPALPPVAAVAAGSAAAMAVSFLGYDRYVFRRERG